MGYDRRRLAVVTSESSCRAGGGLAVVSRWLRSASSCRSGGGLTVVQHRRRLADLEVVSRWCSFAVVRGLRNKLCGGAGLRRFVDRFLSLAVEICWSVVAGGGVLLKLWLGFVGLWWVLQWVKMWLRWLCCCEWWLAVLAGGCGELVLIV